MGSNALQVVVVGQFSGASGRATSATCGPIAVADRPQLVEVEPVEGRRRRLHHGPHLGLGVVGEGHPQRLGRVGVAALGVRVVRPPHDVVDPEIAAQRCLARAQEAGADPEVAGEVLRRRHRHFRRRGAEELRLGRVGRGHAAVEPVQRLEAAGQPGHALLGDHEAQRRVPLEHAGEDEVPDRAVAEPGDLNEHHGPRRFVLAVVGQRAAAVDVDRHVEIGTDLPQRLVVVLPQRRQVGIGRDGGQQNAAEGVEGLGGPAHLGDRVGHVVGEDLDDAGPPARRGGAEVGQPAVVGLDAGPAALVVLGRRRQGDQVPLGEEGGHGVGEEHLGRNAVGLGLGQAPARCPSCGRRSAPAGRRTG